MLLRMLIDHHPIQSQVGDGFSKLIELDGLYHIAVRSQIVAFIYIRIFLWKR